MKKDKVFLIVILIICIGGVIMFISFKLNKIKHIEEKICLEITGDMKIEQYDIGTNKFGEEHGAIKIFVNYNLEQINERIGAQYGKNYINTDYMNLYKHEDVGFWNEMRSNKIEAYYFKMISGKKSKTICVEIYVISDEENKNYLYIFY